MNNNIVMATQPQKKEQLIKELDAALNRKIQQKYSNQPKSHQISTHSTLKQSIIPEENKSDPKQQTKLYRSKDYFAKSPINSKHSQLKKQSSPEIMKNKKQTQHLYKAILNKEISISKPILTEESQKQSYLGNSRSPFPADMQENVPSRQNQSIERLREQNGMLQNELSHLKTCIKELENQSKRLKRQESQYLTLRQQNNSLKRQIDYLRNKIKSSEEGKTKQANGSNIFPNLAEIMKKIMMQLNINFIDKQWSNQFVIQSLKNVSKGIYKLAEQKTKLTAKINTFDIQTVLAKENNFEYKKQIEELRKVNAKYQKQVENFKNKIAKMEAQFEEALNQNLRIQAKYRQSYRQLQTLKKEHRITIQSYKHRKPKRQTYLRRQTQVALEETNTLMISSLQVQVQTESQLAILKDNQNQYKKKIEVLEEQIFKLNDSIAQFQLKNGRLQKQLCELEQQLTTKNEELKQLQSINFQNRIKLAELQQKKYHYESYIKQLESKSEQINNDISNFMPQLKQMEEQNHALIAANAQKDQDIIAKMQTINQLRDENQQKQDEIAVLRQTAKTQLKELQILSAERDRLRGENDQISQLYKHVQNQLNQKENEYMEQMEKTQKDMQSVLLSKIESYSQISTSKENQLRSMQAEWKEKERQLMKIITALNEKNKEFEYLEQKVSSNVQVFTKQKNRLKQAVQQIMILNNQVTKKQTQYQAQYNTVQNKLIALQAQNNLINQAYYQLQLTSERIQQEIMRLKRQNDVLAVKNQNFTNQLTIERLNLEKMKIQIANYLEIKKKQDRQICQLKAKNQQLSIFISDTLSETKRKQENLLALQQKASVLEDNLSHLQLNEESKISQIFMLQERIANLANQNRTLYQQYEKLKRQAEEQSKTKTEQLSNQSYDIQRLMRENRQLKASLQQMNFLSSSKQFKKSELETKVLMLTQQNASLAKKYQYLSEQLEVRERSKEEDKYISQLKNKQYCLILRNILSNIVDVSDLENCVHFEELLQFGADRAINHKKDMRNLESLKKKEIKRESYHNQYQVQHNHQQIESPRKFNFGIQINSYQDLIPQLPQNSKQADMNKQAAEISPASPRSLIFNLSPSRFTNQRQQSRKSRFNTQYLNTLNPNQV